ncbi:hypothetical protein PUN28_004907 [Cardiocondyla obscurior]|uniref:Secreted protein n=1 Tax=Cardiocondyla obscurior TaxID=286306 RepID=A0AAW2GFP4_9HYME
MYLIVVRFGILIASLCQTCRALTVGHLSNSKIDSTENETMHCSPSSPTRTTYVYATYAYDSIYLNIRNFANTASSTAAGGGEFSIGWLPF